MDRRVEVRVIADLRRNEQFGLSHWYENPRCIARRRRARLAAQDATHRASEPRRRARTERHQLVQPRLRARIGDVGVKIGQEPLLGAGQHVGDLVADSDAYSCVLRSAPSENTEGKILNW